MHRCISLVLTALLLAAAAEVEITDEPHHHLIFSNDQVRIFNVEVPAGSQTQMHWHRHDYIYVTLGATALSNEVEGKPPVMGRLQDGETGFAPGPFAHLVRISAGQPFHNITVELSQDEKLRHSPEHWDQAHPEEDRGLNILEGGTQEILFVKDGVRVSEIDLQPNGMAPMSKNPQLLVPITDVHLILQGPANAPHPPSGDVDRKSGEVEWSDHGFRPLMNHTNAVAKFVILEFH
jgi:quercetin dioxygenase-like cupin family protein